MSAKIVLVICALVAIVSSVPAQVGPGIEAWGGPGGWGGAGAWGGAGLANPWMPSWLLGAPWNSQRLPCVGFGGMCLDCNTKQVCTKFGSMQFPCDDPTLPYCNAGKCSATPSVGCGAPAVNAVAPPTIAAV